MSSKLVHAEYYEMSIFLHRVVIFEQRRILQLPD
jgi:hypothetical protein